MNGRITLVILLLIIFVLLIFFNKYKESYTGNLRVATEMDRKRALKYALKNICEKKGYAWYESPDDQFIYDCKHTKNTCNNESVYPTKEGTTPRYYEWRDNDSPDGLTVSSRIPSTIPEQNGFCILGNEAFRKTCEDEFLKYNKEDGSCKTTEKYCSSKLLSFCKGDCFESPQTLINSRIFGNTLSRPLTLQWSKLTTALCPQ